MYNKEECIYITCDNCSEDYRDDHTGFSLYVDNEAASEAAESDGWYEDNGKHYCPDCYAINDDDSLVLKIIINEEPK